MTSPSDVPEEAILTPEEEGEEDSSESAIMSPPPSNGSSDSTASSSSISAPSAPQATVVPTNSSEVEPTAQNHVLQIIFDPQVQSNRRRKSSLVDIDSQRVSNSSCFVHALLETQRRKTNLPAPSLPAVGANPGVIEDIQSHGGKLDLALARAMKEKQVQEEKLTDCGAYAAMTKSQLNDMVLGVRQLSKHLASMTIRMNIRSVMIITKIYDKSLKEYTARLAKWLLEKNYTVYVESTLASDPQFNAPALLSSCPNASSRLRYWTPELCANHPHYIDFIITLGGDGTVLYASWLFQKVAPPTLSFSLGSLGFLTKFDFNDFESALTEKFNTGVTIGLRLRFEGTIMRSQPLPEGSTQTQEERDLHNEILTPESSSTTPTHARAESFIILNEIVIDRGPNPTLSQTELYGDDMFLTSIAADGVCIATPTGSTAYSLAAGGSLVHPELPGMLVSVICAHSLTFRPLILPDSMVLRVGVPYNARNSSHVSFDGRERMELKPGDYVTIIASRFPFPIVQDKRDNKDWFDSIRRTMMWGTRTSQQRGFDPKM